MRGERPRVWRLLTPGLPPYSGLRSRRGTARAPLAARLYAASLRSGGGRIDVTGKWLVGAKGEYPINRPYLRRGAQNHGEGRVFPRSPAGPSGPCSADASLTTRIVLTTTPSRAVLRDRCHSVRGTMVAIPVSAARPRARARRARRKPSGQPARGRRCSADRSPSECHRSESHRQRFRPRNWPSVAAGRAETSPASPRRAGGFLAVTSPPAAAPHWPRHLRFGITQRWKQHVLTALRR